MTISIDIELLTPEEREKYVPSFEAPYPSELIFSEEEIREQEEIMEQIRLEPERKLNALREKLHARDEKIEKLEAEKEKLKQQITKLLRMVFGQSSEQLKSKDKDQAEPETDGSEEGQEKNAEQKIASSAQRTSVNKPARQPLPKDWPCNRMDYPAACACPECGSTELTQVGTEVSETMKYVPGHFERTEHVRPKMRCRKCDKFLPVPAPDLPILKGKAEASVIADVMIRKFCDHIPLNRIITIYARKGAKLSPSTLVGWIFKTSTVLLSSLAEAIFCSIRSDTIFYADDTPMPVLSPGDGKTRIGRFWTIVSDGRPYGSDAPRAVAYLFSPDRKSEHAQALLKDCQGDLHADGYAGFNCLYKPDPITGEVNLSEVFCWAHVRRKFVEVYEHNQSPAARSFIEQIGMLFAIEEKIKGQPPDRRKRAREEFSIPILNALKTQMQATYEQTGEKSELGKAIYYAVSRWMSLVRYTTDGRLEMTNNAAERAIRPLVIGRKNYLFAGSDKGGQCAAILYTIIETAKMNGVEPYAYLCDVLTRLSEGHPDNRIGELLPWNYRNQAVVCH